jgi:hypothetical protein
MSEPHRESVSAWEISKLSPVSKEEVKPPFIALEAKLISKKDRYNLNLDGKSPEEFAKLIKGWPLPPSPKVDLVLTIRNTGTKTLTFNPRSLDGDIMLSLYLTGDGAMNHPLHPTQLLYTGDRSKEETLAPGKTYEIPILSLDCGDTRRSYWLLPGEYPLHASCLIHMKPDPGGASKIPDGSEWVDLQAPPLRVKVEAAK